MWFERLEQEATDGLITGPYEVHKARKLLAELRVGAVVQNYVEEFCSLVIQETEIFVCVSGTAASNAKLWKGVAYQSSRKLFTSYSPVYWGRLFFQTVTPTVKDALNRSVRATKALLAGHSAVPERPEERPEPWPTYDDLRSPQSSVRPGRQMMALLRPQRAPSNGEDVLTPNQTATHCMRELKRLREAVSIYIGGMHLCLEGFTALLRDLVEQVHQSGAEAPEIAEQRARLEHSIVQYIEQAYTQLHLLLTELVCDNTRALAQRKRPQMQEADSLIPTIHVDLRASIRHTSNSCLKASQREGEAIDGEVSAESLAKIREERLGRLQASLESTCQQRAHTEQLGLVFRQLSEHSLVTHKYRESKWLPYTVITLVGAATAIALYRRGVSQVRSDVREVSLDFCQSAVRFVDGQLWQPLCRMYRAVRYDEASMSTINREAVHAEELVLGVMVREFMQDTSAMDAEQLYQLEQLAISGDISGILPLYTAAIRHPIKEALFGSLLRLVLIQVHKVKLDAEKISVVIDQLLRSNELLFQATAMTPAVLLIALLFYQGMVFISGSPSNKKIHARLRTNLRNIEIVLNKYNEAKFEPGATGESFVQPVVSQKDLGEMVTSVSFMLSTARWLPQEQRITFIKDALQLVNSKLTITQRMAVLQRIFHTHSFLQEW